jgi:OmpA family
MIPEQMLRMISKSIKDLSNHGESHTLRGTIVAIGGVVAVASLALSLTGCAPARARTQTADFIDVLASGTRNEPEPYLAAPDMALLRHAALSSDDAVAYVVNPSTGQATRVALTPRRPDGQVDYGPDRGDVLTANLRAVQRLVRSEVARTPFDLLSFIAAAVRVTTGKGTLIVVSSGLSTAGAFDLRQVGWGASPTAIARQLKQAGALPALAGWQVVFSNLATTAPPQPVLPLSQRSELTSYWLAICRAAGAADCRTDEVTRPAGTSRSTLPVPVVPVPAVRSVQGPHGWHGPDIPADAFFAFNSSRLLPGAVKILGPIATKVIRTGQKIRIVGFSSPDGGSLAYNLALSVKRAESVKTALLALNVPGTQIVQVTGEGTNGHPAADCFRDGHLDEAICARLRHVLILLSPVRPTGI